MVNPDLQENDVKAVITVKLVDRYGTVFQDEDQATLGGILDPANRGHLARSVEENFARMGSVVVATFNKLVDARTQEKEVEKPQEEAPNGNIKMTVTPPIVSLEALKAALPPPPRMPGAGASLNPSGSN